MATFVTVLVLLIATTTAASATPPPVSCGKIVIDVVYRHENNQLCFYPLNKGAEPIYLVADTKNINDPGKKRLPARLFRWKGDDLYYRGKRYRARWTKCDFGEG
jgi:hypothetical protein